MIDVKSERLDAKTDEKRVQFANKDNEFVEAIRNSDTPVGGTPAVMVKSQDVPRRVSNLQRRIVRRLKNGN